MQLQSFLLASISLLSAASAAPYELEARQVPSKPCSHQTGGVHVIAIPGAGNADPPYGLIGTLATSILNAIPGSTNVSVPYDHAQTNGVLQTQQAGATMRQYIADYERSCPGTKIVLLGYSAGAVSMMNVLCGETNPPYNPAVAPLSLPSNNNVIAAVAYGEEGRTPNTRWDFGTCTGSGIHPRRNPAGCQAWRFRLRSYCNKEDPECCATTGTDPNAHYTYPQEYDKTATDFVKRRLGKSGGA